MKKLLPVVSFLVLSGVVAAALRASAPAQAQSQASAQAQGLEARVATLEAELAAEKKKHEETRALLDQTLQYLDKQSKAAQTLLGVLDESEKQGFSVGENWSSRKTLLAGLRAYWGDAQAGLPKPPAAAPAAKPAQAPAAKPAPARPARPQ